MAEVSLHDAPFLELRGIHKKFGGVHALRGVDLTITEGKAYHLLGENGCGKSTVIKIISGAHEASDGKIYLDGVHIQHLSPIEALGAGIETVYQDLSLLPNLTVAENVALGEQLVVGKGSLMRLLNRKKMNESAREALSKVGLDADWTLLNATVADLPLAIRQRVAIARAIAAEARLVIMDEPTTALTRQEVEVLIEVVGRLLANNVAVLFVTHKLEESYRIGGDVIVFRDGLCVTQGPLEKYSRTQLAELMTGRSIESVRYRTGTPQSRVLLCARGLSSGNHFRDVDFSLKKGEIIGVTGLSDSGRNELAMSLAGHVPLKKGSLKLDEESIMIGSPAEAISHGIGYVPEDRLSEGLFVEQSIYLNEVPLILDRISAKFGLLNDKKGRMAASDISAKMKLNTEDVDLPVGSLSGGNQQRVLIGRWLSINPRLLILHGPTVGVDIGSKETIFRAIQDMAERGIGIMIISDDLPELLQNCDRILVMNSGRIVEDLRAQDVNEDCIYKSMLGDNQMEFLE
jgi:simple sugar transport system ATP-binding protein